MVAGALAIAGGAQGAASPVSPASGAIVISSHPLFVWTVPAGEVSRTIQIARAPQTTPSGEFYSENVVTSDFFDNETTTQWSPTSQLYAGSYWWSVGTRNDDFDYSYSPPRAFRIPVVARITSVRLKKTTYDFFADELEIIVRWASNTKVAVVTASITRGKRLLYRARQTEDLFREASFDWERPRLIRTGTLLKVTVTLRTGGAVRTAVRAVRAP